MGFYTRILRAMSRLRLKTYVKELLALLFVVFFILIGLIGIIVIGSVASSISEGHKVSVQLPPDMFYLPDDTDLDFTHTDSYDPTQVGEPT